MSRSWTCKTEEAFRGQHDPQHVAYRTFSLGRELAQVAPKRTRERLTCRTDMAWWVQLITILVLKRASPIQSVIEDAT